MVTPILQMGKVRLREVRSLAQGHPPEVVRLAPRPLPLPPTALAFGLHCWGALLNSRLGERGTRGSLLILA